MGTHAVQAPKSGAGKFAIPASLSQVKLTQPSAQEEAARLAKEEITLDPNVTVDAAAFKEAITVIRDRYAADNRMSLATSMNPDNAELEHNRWVQKVPNEVQKKMLGNEKQIVSELREKLGVPTLFLEIQVVEPAELQGQQQVPYTMQEKLEAMKQKNPDLEAFLRRFNANLQYD